MSRKIVMYSDSYMKRMQEYCSGDLHVPGTIHWFDKGSLCADFMKRDCQSVDIQTRAMYDRMLLLQPDIASINVSDKDITSKMKPKEIFNLVISIVTDLQTAGVTTIYVGEIMTRSDFSRSPDPNLEEAIFDLKSQKIIL